MRLSAVPLAPLIVATVVATNCTNGNQHNLTPIVTNTTGLVCHDISLVPIQDRCQFAYDHCEEYKIGFINYVTYYQCHVRTRPIIIISYAAILFMLFTTLGLTASEFLCPNLDTLANFFKMSESLAGVTLLALGNGSPDVFSTLEAMKIDSPGLAIGELIGAALFITCCVVGSMAIVHPFDVARRAFVRDVLFLLAGLTLTVVILRDGKISIIDSFILILFYAFYVIFVVIWDYKLKAKRRKVLLDKKARNQFGGGINSNLASYEVEASNEINDDDLLPESQLEQMGIDVLDQELNAEFSESFENWSKESNEPINPFRPNLLQALDFNNRMNEIYDHNNDAISLHTIHPAPLKFTPESVGIKMSSAPSYTDYADDGQAHDDTRANTAPAELHYEGNMHAKSNDSDNDLMDISSVTGLYDRTGEFEFSDQEEAHKILKQKMMDYLRKRGIDKKSSFAIKLLFPTISNFSAKSIVDKACTIICLPLVTILRLTVPVIHTEDKKILVSEVWDGKEHRDGYLLLLLQSVVSPFITYYLMFYDGEYSWPFIIIPLILAAGFVYVTRTIKAMSDNGSEFAARTFTIALTSLGFIISITWISAIATELIAIIKFFSLIFHLSDAILGVTVFAIGNSLGDFISNFTIAKMGFPMMALSACFGGPLLNILLGVGGSSLYVLTSSGQEEIEFEISKTLIVSGLTLVINFVFLIIRVPMNNWRMDQRIGWSMIALWSAATLVCVLLEVIGLS